MTFDPSLHAALLGAPLRPRLPVMSNAAFIRAWVARRTANAKSATPSAAVNKLPPAKPAAGDRWISLA